LKLIGDHLTIISQEPDGSSGEGLILANLDSTVILFGYGEIKIIYNQGTVI
jgi:hypothetical protein